MFIKIGSCLSSYDMFFPFKKKTKKVIAKFEKEFVYATKNYFKEQNKDRM